MTPREEAERIVTEWCGTVTGVHPKASGASLIDAIAAALTAHREDRDGEIAALRSQVERLQEKSAYLRDDNTRLEQERDLARQDSQRLREALKTIEWNYPGIERDGTKTVAWCPYCGLHKHSGHGADCIVDAALSSQQPEERCERCGWPLAKTRSAGCVKGDCSQRPLPPQPEGTGKDA